MKGLIFTNPAAFWGLISSVIVVLIIGFVTWIYLRIKTKKIKKKLYWDKSKKIKKILV